MKFFLDILIWRNQTIETYNTRLFKEEEDGRDNYILRLASVATTGEVKNLFNVCNSNLVPKIVWLNFQ